MISFICINLISIEGSRQDVRPRAHNRTPGRDKRWACADD